MSKMVPPAISRFTKSPGERELFESLRNDPQTKDWIVVHSWDIAKHPTNICGEVDFICIIPGLGVLCVEVKAHASVVRHQDGTWILGRDEDRDGPFKQAANARYATANFISDHDPSLRALVFWSCVVFTRVDFDQQSGEWHPWQIINQSDLAKVGIARSLIVVLTRARQFLETCATATWFRPDQARPSKPEADRIAELLRPCFEFFQSPRARLDESETELKVFTEAQYAALDRMESNPRTVFVGPAGSGKSLVALESARRCVAAGQRTLFICYNHEFSKWLKKETAPLGDLLKAGSFHSILVELTGADLSQTTSKFWNEKLPQLAIQRLKDRDPSRWLYDRLIIDEAQDILSSDYIDCLDLMLSGGFLGGNFQMFGDFDNQTVFSHSYLNLADFRLNYVPDFAIYKLDENCRNRPRVGYWAKALGRMYRGYSRYLRQDDHIDPMLKYYASEKEAKELLRWAVSDAHKRGFLAHEITVLYSSMGDPNPNVLEIGSLRLSKYDVADSQNMIGDARYSTVRKFKGLESRAIILAGLNDLQSDDGADLFYTACTRTTGIFYFLADHRVKTQIAALLSKAM